MNCRKQCCGMAKRTLLLVSGLLILVSVISCPSVQAQSATAVPNAFFGASVFTSSFPLAGGMALGSYGKVGGIVGHWLEPTCDGGTDPNNACYTLSGLTGYVNKAKSQNLIVVYDFAIPGWQCGQASNTHCTTLPSNLTLVSNFATAIAKQYKGQIQYYETGNEVNNAANWTDTCAKLVLLHNTIYAAIKAVDPNAIVGAPNLAAYNGTQTGGGACVSSPAAAGNVSSTWLNNFLQTRDSNGHKPTVDTVGVHTYAAQVPTSLDGCDFTNNKLHCAGAPLLHLYNSFRTVMTNNGIASSVPLLVTEGGLNVDNESGICPSNVNNLTACLTNSQQVAYVGRWLAIGASTWSDGGGQLPSWYGYDVDWGTLNGTSGMNPQNASAYGQMESWLRGAVFQQQCHSGAPSTVFVCDFSNGAGQQAEIVFNDNNGSTASYRVPSWATTYQPLLGSAQAITGGSVTVGDTPIALTGTALALPLAPTGLTIRVQ
jgi:hypothetical protein